MSDLAAAARILAALAPHLHYRWAEQVQRIADHFEMIAKPGVAGPDSLSTQDERDAAAALLAAARREVAPDTTEALKAPESVAVGPAEESASEPCEAVSGEMRGQRDPAERLRRVADLVEQRAAAATHGPWQPEYAYGDHTRVQAVFAECDPSGVGCDADDCVDGTHGIGGFDRDSDNRWSILTGPQIAPHLAAWLRVTADDADLLDRGNLPGGALGKAATVAALALADAILAGEDR